MFSNWRKYTKGIVAGLVPIAMLVQASVSDGKITQDEWVKIILAVLGAAGVVGFKNLGYTQPTPSDLARKVDTASGKLYDH